MPAGHPSDTPIVAGDTLPRRAAVIATVLFLVPPIAWALSLGVSYLIDDFVCTAAASAGAPAPAAGVKIAVISLNLVLLAATLASGVLAVVNNRRAGSRTSVMSFLAWTTAGSAALFGYGIVLIGASVLVLRTCAP